MPRVRITGTGEGGNLSPKSPSFSLPRNRENGIGKTESGKRNRENGIGKTARPGHEKFHRIKRGKGQKNGYADGNKNGEGIITVQPTWSVGSRGTLHRP